jgi:hypothetical protein
MELITLRLMVRRGLRCALLLFQKVPGTPMLLCAQAGSKLTADDSYGTLLEL